MISMHILICHHLGSCEFTEKGSTAPFHGSSSAAKKKMSHKKKSALLSIESWLANRDPYDYL